MKTVTIKNRKRQNKDNFCVSEKNIILAIHIPWILPILVGMFLSEGFFFNHLLYETGGIRPFFCLNEKEESKMPRFFCDQISDTYITLTGEDASHLSRSLRVRVGEEVIVCDGACTDYVCMVESVSSEAVKLLVKKKMANENEAALPITLYQALPKGDKLDFIVQKAVELGVTRIVPVQTRFCIAKATARDFEKKRARLQKIALEAAKQCGRGVIPEVHGLLPFKEMADALALERGFVCYEKGGETVQTLIEQKHCGASVLVGSEGGFSAEEVHYLSELGVPCATLGKRILRCETAPIAALTLLLHQLGEL